MRGTHRHFWRI